MALWLGILLFLQDLSPVPSFTLRGSQPPAPRDLILSFGLLGHLQTCPKEHIGMCMGACTHKIFLKISNKSQVVVVVHAFNPNTQLKEAGRSEFEASLA